MNKSLLEQQAIEPLASEAVVLGHANFGVFSVAYTADQRQRPVILRLTPVRARPLAGGAWRAGWSSGFSGGPRAKTVAAIPNHRWIPAYRGRLLVGQVQPSHRSAPFLLALLTTLEAEVEEIFQRPALEHRNRPAPI